MLILSFSLNLVLSVRKALSAATSDYNLCLQKYLKSLKTKYNFRIYIGSKLYDKNRNYLEHGLMQI